MLKYLRVGLSALTFSLICYSCNKNTLTDSDCSIIHTINNNSISYIPDTTSAPKTYNGLHLLWQDEFNGKKGSPIDQTKWSIEQGFSRNQELQWYQKSNVQIDGNGNLEITARRQHIDNPNYNPNLTGDKNWMYTRKYAEYTSASIRTKDKFQFVYGTMLVRAKIPTAQGVWPAIWLLGNSQKVGAWPACGEIDVMEFYRYFNIPIILANFAIAGDNAGEALWDSKRYRLTDFTTKDPNWTKKYHIWKMEWTPQNISIYIDGNLLNSVDLTQTTNGRNGGKLGGGINPFKYPMYIILNLAIGQHGGDPTNTPFPLKYDIDYIRVYQ